MQTFLPYADFAASAASLDMKRLGKQRVENMQLFKAILTGSGWANHPAAKQWAGYELALLDYQLAICDEWAVVRGYNDTCADKTINMLLADERHIDSVIEYLNFGRVPIEPPWLGDAAYHRSHQSNLIRKDAEHYGPQFPGVPADLEYVWPSRT
jgi:hypothetical protein